MALARKHVQPSTRSCWPHAGHTSNRPTIKGKYLLRFFLLQPLAACSAGRSSFLSFPARRRWLAHLHPTQIAVSERDSMPSTRQGTAPWWRPPEAAAEALLHPSESTTPDAASCPPGMSTTTVAGSGLHGPSSCRSLLQNRLGLTDAKV